MRVPSGNYYLVAQAARLRLLIDDLGGSRLSDRVIWDLRNPVHRENSGKTKPCSVFQYLRSVDKPVFQMGLGSKLEACHSSEYFIENILLS